MHDIHDLTKEDNTSNFLEGGLVYTQPWLGDIGLCPVWTRTARLGSSQVLGLASQLAVDESNDLRARCVCSQGLGCGTGIFGICVWVRWRFYALWFYSFTLHYVALRGVGWVTGWNDGRNCVYFACLRVFGPCIFGKAQLGKRIGMARTFDHVR